MTWPNSVVRGTYQDITNLEAQLRISPQDSPLWQQILSEIGRIVDSTQDKPTFVYGLRVLAEHGVPPESPNPGVDSLDAKVRRFNARAPRVFQVEGYHVKQDGGYAFYRVLRF